MVTEILGVNATAGQQIGALQNLNREMESLAGRDYGLPLRKSLDRRVVLEIVREARSMVWPNLNREPVRLVTPHKFTQLWSSLGVDFRLASFGGPGGLALMGFYARNAGPSGRPLIYVNTAHHPAVVGAAFTHEMGHHLTAKIFAQQNEPVHYLTYTAYAEHLDAPAELAADCLVSLGVFPGDVARKMFAVDHKASERAKPAESILVRVRSYFQSRYGLKLDASLPPHEKLPYLAGMIHFANLRSALLNEYDI